MMLAGGFSETSNAQQHTFDSAAVGNMLNEASSFNCPDILGANLDSEVNKGGYGDKLEENSLIYNTNSVSET